MTNTRMFLVMLWGAIFRRRGRAIMAVVASLVGAATLFCLAATCIAVPQQMNEEMRSYGANLIVTPIESGSGKSGIDAAMVKHTTDMVQAKGAATYATYRYENVRVNAAPYVLAGVHPAQVKALNHHWSVEGAWPSAGNVMVGRDVADAMGLAVGSRITIRYRAADNAAGTGAAASGASTVGSSASDSSVADSSATGSSAAGSSAADAASSADASTASGGSGDILDTSGTEFRVAGIVDTGGSEDEIIYAIASDVDKLAGGSRGVDVIEYSSGAEDVSQVVKSINDMTSMHVQAQQVTKITSSDTRIITMLRTLFWMVSVVVLALTLVGVSTTISSIVAQRRNEIGLRKALGASSGSIGAEFYAESGLYGLVGGLLGTALGYLLARLLTSAVFGRTLGFDWPLAVGSVLLSVIVAVLASVPPVRRASRIDPAVVLREE
ncbi:ABC transporter permease [Bifidobacterium thermophilum]|uniref:ABC transporter permease n=1 Tax=Bifidobacterium thermophilum TaxID=33905 RepID=UPI0030ADF44C